MYTQMKLILGNKEKEVEVEGEEKIEEVLKKQEINPLTVVVKKNGKITPLRDKVKDSDKLEVITAVSQG